jgi:hypothetical protein
MLPVTYDMGSHCNISFETSNDICGLLLLIPPNSGVQAQDTNDDAKIDPVLQTRCKKYSKLHN